MSPITRPSGGSRSDRGISNPTTSEGIDIFLWLPSKADIYLKYRPTGGFPPQADSSTTFPHYPQTNQSEVQFLKTPALLKGLTECSAGSHCLLMYSLGTSKALLSKSRLVDPQVYVILWREKMDAMGKKGWRDSTLALWLL